MRDNREMARPNVNLTDPAIAAAVEFSQRLAKLAYEAAAAKDDAVRPVYALNERTQTVEHVGSCVLVKIQDQYFAFSASHVFDNVGKYQLLFGYGDRLQPFSGD